MDLEERILSKEWFYRFKLPSGKVTRCFQPAEVEPIHQTRLEMMFSVLDPLFGKKWRDATALDLACNQGFFACHLAEKGCRKVLGLEAREELVADARMIAEVYGHDNLFFEAADVTRIDPADFEPADAVLMYGLLYHLENPIGAMRIAAQLTRKVLLIETQVGPGIDWHVDWGAHYRQKKVMGTFTIIDETLVTDNPTASITGFSLCPSVDGLIWILEKMGFARVGVVKPPEGAYEQLSTGKRVVIAAYKNEDAAKTSGWKRLFR